MPIGAIVGAAVVGGGATLAASSKNSKAINKATDAGTASNAASLAVQQQVRDQNVGILSPFVERGNAAGSTINALLGLGGSTTVPQPNAFSQFVPTPQPNVFSQFSEDPWGFGTKQGWQDGNFGVDSYGQFAQPQTVNTPQPPQKSPAEAATDAYNIFKQSTGYQDRLQEGYRGVNAGYAGRGLLQSGAAQKALLRSGQSQASNEFGNYVGYLSNQQGVGLSGANALAGVGTNYATGVTAANTANANLLGQSAIASANNSNAAIGGIGGILGTAIGQVGSTSSYAPPPTTYGTGSYYNPNTTF